MRKNSWSPVAAVVLLAPALAACAAGLTMPEFNPVRPGNLFTTPGSSAYAARGDQLALPAPPAELLVGPDGACTALASDPTPPPPPPPGPAVLPGHPAPIDARDSAPADVIPQTSPLIYGGIALQMAECEVVKRAGRPEKVDIGSNERNERTVVLLYTAGPWPGIYRFAGGRLYSIEASPRPPAPPKKQRRKRRAQKRA